MACGKVKQKGYFNRANVDCSSAESKSEAESSISNPDVSEGQVAKMPVDSSNEDACGNVEQEGWFNSADVNCGSPSGAKSETGEIPSVTEISDQTVDSTPVNDKLLSGSSNQDNEGWFQDADGYDTSSKSEADMASMPEGQNFDNNSDFYIEVFSWVILFLLSLAYLYFEYKKYQRSTLPEEIENSGSRSAAHSTDTGNVENSEGEGDVNVELIEETNNSSVEQGNFQSPLCSTDSTADLNEHTTQAESSVSPVLRNTSEEMVESKSSSQWSSVASFISPVLINTSEEMVESTSSSQWSSDRSINDQPYVGLSRQSALRTVENSTATMMPYIDTPCCYLSFESLLSSANPHRNYLYFRGVVSSELYKSQYGCAMHSENQVCCYILKEIENSTSKCKTYKEINSSFDSFIKGPIPIANRNALLKHLLEEKYLTFVCQHADCDAVIT